MAKPDLGGKRQCLNCGTKFFDLNKDPITCPKCGTIFQVTAATAAAPARASRAAPVDDEETETEDNAETVSLEDADAPDDGKVTAAAPEADEADTDDDTNDDDDTFLEEDEEEDGDVSNLIDGDIESDEER